MTSHLASVLQSHSFLNQAQLSGLFWLLLQHPKLTINSLVHLTGFPKDALKAVLASLKPYLQPLGETVSLNAEGVATAKSLPAQPYKWTLVNLDSTELTAKLTKIREAYSLTSNRLYDQFFAYPGASVAKALVLKEKGLLDKTNLFLLGDDDFVSVALALLPEKNFKIWVFEVDEALLSVLKRIHQDLGTNNIQFVSYDVAHELPAPFRSRADVVITDPPYTKNGVSLFLKRALEMCKKEAVLCLYYGNSLKSPEKFYKIQEIIQKFGLVLEEKFHNFITYEGAESIGSRSSLYFLRTTPFTNAQAVTTSTQSLYTHSAEKEEHFPYVDHVVAKLYEVPTDILKSRNGLVGIMNKFCTQHHLKVAERVATPFRPFGLTVTFVLSNSNLVVHTWPEHHALHLDLITCSPIHNKHQIGESLAELFHTKKMEIRELE